MRAVSGVSLDIFPGETLSVVGETGSGKSTLARSLMHAPPPKSGDVVFQGTSLTGLRGAALRDARRSMQMIFQDPYTSLDPLWPVARIVAEPLVAAGLRDRAKRRRRVGELLEQVGLDLSAHGGRRARELSGGQCQRVAIARALAASPALIIADEAVSSLDVLVQAQVLNLLEGLRTSLGLSYLFIAHDLALVKQVSDRVAVMYLGRLCETGPADEVYARPTAPLHRRAARRGAAGGAGGAWQAAGRRPADGGLGRARVAGQPAVRVPVPHPVPARAARCAAETPALAAGARGPGRGTWSRAISRSPAASPRRPAR